MKLLHLDSSFQRDLSASRAISAAVVERLRAENPGLTYSYRDLAAEPLAHLSSDTLGDEQSRDILAEFKAADVVVIGAALYNFTISSQLKAWIDRILIAGETFRYGESGPEGLAGGKHVIVALARGGVYSGDSPYAPMEHAETLLRGSLAFIGITKPEFIIAEGLAMGDEARRTAIDAALAQARRISLPALAA